DALLAQQVGHAQRVRQVELHEAGTFRDGGSVPGGKVVDDDDVVAGSDQRLGRDAADVAGSAGDEDSHGVEAYRVRSGSPPCVARLKAPTSAWHAYWVRQEEEHDSPAEIRAGEHPG